MLDTFFEYIGIALRYLPPFSLDNALFYSLNACFFLITFVSLRMILRLLLNKQHAHTTKPYSTPKIQESRILVLGDSTAVGTGASSPEDTIAGRLAHDFPNTQVINLGKNGGLIADVRTQIDKVKNQNFDMIIITAGGNDVWHFTRLSRIRRLLLSIFRDANAMSNNRVIFLIYNNIGSAPLFPSLLQYILRKRCVKVQSLIQKTALESRVPTIDLFSKEDHNPFLKNPKELFASDGIHPSSRGYALWYNRMWRKMVQNGFHFNA